jgi:hypothetical protein
MLFLFFVGNIITFAFICFSILSSVFINSENWLKVKFFF